MNANEWIDLERTITNSKRYYTHFDLRTDIGQQKKYILSADKIAVHSFYPFIHYKKDMTKYKSGFGKKFKERDICYAAHIDRCIYQYYSFILNELYNERLKKTIFRTFRLHIVQIFTKITFTSQKGHSTL